MRAANWKLGKTITKRHIPVTETQARLTQLNHADNIQYSKHI